MKDIQSKISYDTAGAVSNVNQLAAALKAYNAIASKILGTKGTKSTKEATKEINSYTRSLDDVKKAADKMAKSTSKAGKKASAAANEAAKAGKKFLLSWESIARIGAMQVVHQAVSKIASSFRQATTEARELGISIAEIQTIGPQFADFDKLADGIKNLSDASGIEIQDVSAGMYQTLSNQVAAAGNEFLFMGHAADLAIAGVSSLEGSVNLLSSAINSYGQSASTAGIIADQMFKAVELGRFKIEDIADSYGRVAGLSSQIGVSTAEVNAALATLTSTGMDAHEAMTLITNTQLKLIKPTKALKKTYDDLGVATAEAGIQAWGYQGFIAKITESAGSSATALGKLFGRIRAVRGAMGMSGTLAERYAKYLKEIENSMGAVAKAKEIIFKSNAKQLSNEFNAAKNSMIELGDSFNTGFLTLLQLGGGAVSTMEAITKGAMAAGAAFVAWKTYIALTNASIAVTTARVATLGASHTALIGLTAAAATTSKGFVALAIAAKRATLAMLFTPVGALIAVGVVVAGAVIAYNRLVDAANRAAKSQHAVNDIMRQAAVDAQILANEADKRHGNKTLSALQRNLTARVKLEAKAARETALISEQAFSSISNQVGDRISAVERYFDSIAEKAKSTHGTVLQLKDALSNVGASIADYKFDIKQEKRNVFTQVNKSIRRSVHYLDDYFAAARAGDKEGAAAAKARMMHYAKEAEATAQSTGDAATLSKARKNVVRAMRAEETVLESRIVKEKRIGELAKDEIKANAIKLTGIKAIAKAMDDIKITPEMSEKDRADATKRKGELAALFEKELHSIKGSKIFGDLDLTEQISMIHGFAAIHKGAYDVMSGQVVSWEKMTVDAINRVSEAMRKIAPGEGAGLEELGVGGQSATKQQADLVEMGKTLNEVTTAKNNLAQAEANLASKMEVSKLKIAGFLTGMKDFFYYTHYTKDSVDALSVTFKQAFTDIAAAISSGEVNSKAFSDNMRNLELAAAGMDEEHAKRLLAVIKSFREAAAAAKVAIEDKELADVGTKIQERLDDAALTIPVKVDPELGKNLEAEPVKVKVETDAPEQVDVIKRLLGEIPDKTVKAEAKVQGETEAKALATAIGNLRNKTIVVTTVYKTVGKPANAKHGRLFRAEGGDARGTDTIPAMLSPGEFVVNAGATRNNYSQLVSANADHRYLGNGGGDTTFNNNFNISGSDAPQQTAREIQKLLRRENRIRR